MNLAGDGVVQDHRGIARWLSVLVAHDALDKSPCFKGEIEFVLLTVFLQRNFARCDLARQGIDRAELDEWTHRQMTDAVQAIDVRRGIALDLDA